MSVDAYERLRRQARRWSRSSDDADDLLQDALVAALTAHREPLINSADERWLAGVIRNLAAMDARTHHRRRTRERAWAGTQVDMQSTSPDIPIPFEQVLGSMTPASRSVATLILHGVGPDEIRWILSLSAPALRQRLVSIRRTLGRLPAELRADALASALHRPGAEGLDLRLIRGALREYLARRPGIGTHDLDGHLIVVAHNPRVRGN